MCCAPIPTNDAATQSQCRTQSNFNPPPANTGMSRVADVAGTTLANDAFWAEPCKTIPSNTLFIVLDMGAVRDFFKPTEGSTYCEMLQSSTKHQWSADGVD